MQRLLWTTFLAAAALGGAAPRAQAPPALADGTLTGTRHPGAGGRHQPGGGGV